MKQVTPAIFILLLAMLWSYAPVLRELGHIWRSSEDYSAGALVPFVGAWVVWSRRRDLANLAARTCWWGLLILFASQVIRLAGLYWMFTSAERYSLVLAIAGITLLLTGAGVTWRLRWVLAFLLLMIPLPVRVHEAVALPLQSFATSSAVFGLEMLGYLVQQENHLIRMPDGNTLAVEEACSGLRMLMAFVIVGAAFAFLVRRPGWQKAVVMLSTAPLAIAINSLRLIVTAVLYERVSGAAAHRFCHDFAGLAMMPAAVILLAGEFRLLRALSLRKQSAVAHA